MKATKRQGIPHLSFKGNSMEMPAHEFVDMVKWIEDEHAKLSVKNISISEKVDGAGLRFGLSADNKFFIESSRSGPQFNSKSFSAYATAKTGSTNPIAQGYDDIFDRLNENPRVRKILDKYQTPTGLKVICEVLLNQFGVRHDTDKDLIKMVATWYHISKIGNFATFVLFSVEDGNGELHPKSKEIIGEFKKITDDMIKFDDSIISKFEQVDLKNEIAALNKLVAEFEQKYESTIEKIITDKKRDKNSIAIRKEIKNAIGKHQEIFSKKIGNLLKVGKFGPQYEGLVVKLANGIQFKVVSDFFKSNKFGLVPEAKSFKDIYFTKRLF